MQRGQSLGLRRVAPPCPGTAFTPGGGPRAGSLGAAAPGRHPGLLWSAHGSPEPLPTPTTTCSITPASPPAHLQAQGGPAASQKLADVAQALALAPGLRVDLQHRAQKLNHTGRPRARPEATPRAPAGRSCGRIRTGEPRGQERPRPPQPPPLLTLFPSSGLHQSQAPSLTRNRAGAGSDVFRPRP